MMTEPEKDRYMRQSIIPQIGEQGQEKLKNAKVLVVGAGGLGCPVLLYLAAAGTGTIGLVDGDTVAWSNLQRQILYSEKDIGKTKVEVAEQKLRASNSNVKITVYRQYLDPTNAESILNGYDLVLGATDNFESRYLIDKVSRRLGIPFIHGSIHEFEGQVGVFNYRGCCSYSDLFPSQTPGENLSPGVFGAVPGIIGSLMAAEAIKIITGAGEVMAGKLLVLDVLKNSCNIIRY